LLEVLHTQTGQL